VLLIAAAPARADDAGVYAAYQGRNREMNTAIKTYVKASKRFGRAHGHAVREARGVIAADGNLNRALDLVIGDVVPQEPSSDNGANGKTLALKALRSWKLEDVYETRALRAYIRGRPKLVRSWYRKVTQTGRRTDRYLTQADAAFKAAGVPPKAN
jgi:hypothetical protein